MHDASGGTEQQKHARIGQLLRPCFEQMVVLSKAGCTCSLEEHKNAVAHANEWIAKQAEQDRPILRVYQLTARDFGSATDRRRCVLTTFDLDGERDQNPFRNL